MTTDESGLFVAGETGLVVTVHEAESVTGEWRTRFDPAARTGVPPHVTVLYPFLPVDWIDPATVAALGELFARRDAFELELDRCARFPDVLYLALAREQPVRALTEAVTARWPEVPPYGGAFDDVIPHLTVAMGQPTAVYDEIEAAITPSLPIRATVAAVDLLAFEGPGWRTRATFPLRRPLLSGSPTDA